MDPAVGDIQLPALDVTAVIPAGVERGPLGPPPPAVDMTQLNILSVYVYLREGVLDLFDLLDLFDESKE